MQHFTYLVSLMFSSNLGIDSRTIEEERRSEKERIFSSIGDSCCRQAAVQERESWIHDHLHLWWCSRDENSRPAEIFVRYREDSVEQHLQCRLRSTSPIGRCQFGICQRCRMCGCLGEHLSWCKTLSRWLAWWGTIAIWDTSGSVFCKQLHHIFCVVDLIGCLYFDECGC